MESHTVLVTGACGEIGRGLLTFLTAEGANKIIALDLCSAPDDMPLQSSHNINFISGNILDEKLIGALSEGYTFDVIFHLAALLSSKGEHDPELTHKVNVNGTFNILKLAKLHSERRGQPVKVIFPSTIAVYGMEDSLMKRSAARVCEDQYLNPLTMYGINKLYIEHLGRYFSHNYKLFDSSSTNVRVDFRSVRFPGILSAHSTPSGGTSDYGPEMIHAAAQGVPYRCYVTPEATLPFMAMPDAVLSLISLSRAERAKLTRHVYNVSSFSVSAQDIFNEVKQFFPDANVSFIPDKKRMEIVESWPADIDDTAARRDWSWKPVLNREKTFREYLVPHIKERYGNGKKIANGG